MTATASGGLPPYVYVWQRLSGNSSTQATAPSGPTTEWFLMGSVPPIPVIKASTWRCQVSDANSAVVVTGDVAVSIDIS